MHYFWNYNSPTCNVGFAVGLHVCFCVCVSVAWWRAFVCSWCRRNIYSLSCRWLSICDALFGGTALCYTLGVVFWVFIGHAARSGMVRGRWGSMGARRSGSNWMFEQSQGMRVCAPWFEAINMKSNFGRARVYSIRIQRDKLQARAMANVLSFVFYYLYFIVLQLLYRNKFH